MKYDLYKLIKREITIYFERGTKLFDGTKLDEALYEESERFLKELCLLYFGETMFNILCDKIGFSPLIGLLASEYYEKTIN